jgi:hypothetical protein
MELESNFFPTSSIKLAFRNVIDFVRKNIFSILFLFISTSIFFLIFKLSIATDLSSHIRILKEHLKYGYFPIPPLYYFTIYLVGFLMPIYPLMLASIFVLGVFSFLKYLVVQNYLVKELAHLPVLFVGFLIFTLMFIGPVVIPFFNNRFLYAGKFTSTVWHNSTTIFVFPFCIWLFIKSLDYLKKPRLQIWVRLIAVSLIIILAKPSFLFPFLIVFPLICLYKFQWTKWFYYSLLLSIIITIGIGIEQRILYNNNPLDKLWYHGESSKIIIAPFKVWLLFAKYPLVDIASSFLFVIGFIFFKFKSLKHNMEIIYALSLLAISLVIYFILAESGPRFMDGNFYWQIPFSLLIVYIMMLKNIFHSKVNRTFKSKYKEVLFILTKEKILFILYSFQFLSGIYYAFRLINSKNFY